MKFDRAIIRNLDGDQPIETEEIVKQPNYLSIRNHLYCPGAECKARLVMNIRSTGKAYLSKHKGYKHSESCVYYTDEEKSVRSFTEYRVINGGISDDGILRRKNEGLKSLEEYLYPIESEERILDSKKV